MPTRGDWTTLQLAEYLEALAGCPEVVVALSCAVERAAESLDAQLAAVVDHDRLLASVGFAAESQTSADLTAAALAGTSAVLDLPSVGTCHVVSVPLEDSGPTRLVVARRADEPFDAVEVAMLRAMARVLSQSLRFLRTLEAERTMRAESDRQTAEKEVLLASLTERQRLLERLARIQRSISHGTPLQEVFDAITSGARDLLGEEVVGLRLIDPDDRGSFVLASLCGLDDSLREALQRGPVGQGAGGRAITENRLITVYDYADQSDGIPELRATGLVAAMAAPVHERGEVAGSLVVASYRPGRRFTVSEEEALLTFAEHASLALTDARHAESMREAHRAKELFLAMVSHELKTPLTVIMGILRTLQTHGRAVEPDMQEQLLGTAFTRGRELERLIDRLLRGARAELAGVRRVAALADLIAAGVAGFEQLRQIEVVGGPSVKVDVDTAAFQDVIGILVENAVSHSPADTSVIVCGSATGPDVRVSVTNTGSLPKDTDPAMLFQPFRRGDDPPSAGVGLGLHIAARQAESIGGRIDAESSDGYVVFTLVVPAAVVPEFDGTGPERRDTVGAPSASLD
ncbi:MAG TPA: GAF domain-containing sensor histidine kinase [Mycobacteriales bacterium]|nr:GAF domain-containing sensor histidine kinase [Mycobacteriales bacterium]